MNDDPLNYPYKPISPMKVVGLIIATAIVSAFLAVGIFQYLQYRKEENTKLAALTNDLQILHHRSMNYSNSAYRMWEQREAAQKWAASLLGHITEFATNDMISELGVSTARAWTFKTNVAHDQTFVTEITPTNVVLRKALREDRSSRTNR